MATSLRMVLAITIVAMISGGQILFKVAAEKLHASQGQLTPSVMGTVALSFAIYGLATLGWIWLLQWFSLSRIYPVMALSFILVPIGSAILFGERLTISYFAGVALLLSGLLIILGPRQ
jgi:drug/metabolite transporter (DMT)-like permease